MPEFGLEKEEKSAGYWRVMLSEPPKVQLLLLGAPGTASLLFPGLCALGIIVEMCVAIKMWGLEGILALNSCHAAAPATSSQYSSLLALCLIRESWNC